MFGLLGGAAFVYFVLRKAPRRRAEQRTPVRDWTQRPTSENSQVSSEGITLWVREYLDGFRKKLLGFYVNEQMREHIVEISAQQETQIIQEYGRLYESPELYIYREFKRQFPSAKESDLDKSLRVWLQDYPSQTGVLTSQIRKALEPEVREEAEKIINQKLSQFLAK